MKSMANRQQTILSAFSTGTKSLQGRLINPYQRDGVLWMLSREITSGIKGGFLCDEMGLGKTVQLITLMISNPKPKTLVVVPVSVLAQWKEEINKFAPHLRVYIHHGASRPMSIRDIPEFDVFLTTYSLIRLKNIEDVIPAYYEWDRIICDEAHELRNAKSRTAKNLGILRSSIHWCVTGTPVFNNIKDFVSLGTFVGIPALSIQVDIETIRKKYVLRRTKEDVAEHNKRLELPPCEVQNVELKMYEDEHRLYKTVYEDCKKRTREIIRSGIAEGMKAMLLLECFLRARQCMAHPMAYLSGTEEEPEWDENTHKVDYLLDSLTENNERGEKSIVFCQFIVEMNVIQSVVESAGIPVYRIDGSVSQEGRVQELNKFRASKGGVILIQIKAGGQGINLQEATRVYITSPSWNPATELQAIGRAHRTGQTQKVFVERLIYKGEEELPSIEESIMGIQDHKNIVTSEVLNDSRILAKLPTRLKKNTLNIRTLKLIFS
jgi:SNF2 family DNA or RNA helicase